MAEGDCSRLEAALDAVRRPALFLRQSHASRTAAYRERVLEPLAALQRRGLADCRREVEAAAAAAQTDGTATAILGAAGRLAEAARRYKTAAAESRAIAPAPPEIEAALAELEGAMLALRDLGDELDVDTRSLPVTWRVDLDWCMQVMRTNKKHLNETIRHATATKHPTRYSKNLCS